MTIEIKDVKHDHYADRAAFVAGAGDKNWGFILATNELAVNKGGSFFYFPNTTTVAANLSGTTNRLVKFTAASVGGNSNFYDNGTTIGIGSTQVTTSFIDCKQSNSFLADNIIGFNYAPTFGFSDALYRSNYSAVQISTTLNGNSGGGLSHLYHLQISSATLLNGATTSGVWGIHINDPQPSDPLKYGIEIESLTTVSPSITYAIKTGAVGQVYFGDKLTVIGTLGITGASTFTSGSFSTILGVTGVATFTAAPIFSSGTASQTMELNGSKALVTVAITGTGNYVKSASPTMTGTIAASAMTLSSTLGVTGDLSVNTNKFNVTASNGNTLVAGTLGVTGIATFSSSVIAQNALFGNTTIRNANPAGADPAYAFEIINDNTALQVISIRTYGPTGAGHYENNCHWDRYRGTLASPTATQSGDIFMSMGYRGYDGTSLSQSMAGFHCYAAENFDATHGGTYFDFECCPIGSAARTLIMEIRGNSIKGVKPFNAAVGSSLRAYGLGDIDAANNEGLIIDHDGATYGRMMIFSNGTGVTRPLLLGTNGTAGISINTSQVSTFKSAVGTTAGGVMAINFGSGSATPICWGSGTPSLSAAKGALYLRTDGTTTNNRAYINTDGGTTWTALTTVA